MAKALGLFMSSCITLVFFAAVALADKVLTGEVIGDWQFECADQTVETPNCALVQTVIDRDANEPVVRLSFSVIPQENSVVVSVLLPLGVDLPEGAFVTYDNNSLALPFRLCLVQGCLARRALEIEDLQMMAVSDTLSVQFFAVGLAEPAKVMSSSHGLRDAFQRLGLLTVE
jgi:invasion protein IalB